jgi:hypothetical protein
MQIRIAIGLLCSPIVVSLFGCSDACADPPGVHCQIDQISFVGDDRLTRIDYVIPPGGKPPRFRLLAGQADEARGSISVELKTREVIPTGTPLSQEPTWKSVLKLPKQRDSAITSGSFVFTHFDPRGEAAGTVQFKTADGHQGECQFRLAMHVVDLSHTP